MGGSVLGLVTYSHDVFTLSEIFASCDCYTKHKFRTRKVLPCHTLFPLFNLEHKLGPNNLVYPKGDYL